MNIKKMFTALSAMVVAVTMIPGLTALAATPDTELGQAYEWAYANGITTMDSYEAANMTAPISRAQMAKMLSVYATKILGMTPDTSKDCTFSDIASVQGDLHDYIIESCQLGLMGQGITAFRPYDLIPRSEFGTALSRTLWGETYNGGTPFYAKHLDALKEAKIMTKIANAENTNEIRGYVMIMLQRAAEAGIDCDDTDVVLACLDDINNCPAICKSAYDDEDNTDTSDEVVKSGSLVVKATPSTNRKAVGTGVSDLDTITLKASEAITLNSVTLERYGYSDGDSVQNVWLEDENGTQITNPKKLSKDKVTLTLKKDYKELDSTDVFTIVVELQGAEGSIGFKVVDVDASAKNLDLSDYDPYTYEIVNYQGATVTLTQKGKNDTYNYEEGKSYEVQRFKAKAESSTITVNWFTFKKAAWSSVDLQDGVAKVEVTVNDEAVDGLKWEINSKDELKINFDEVEIATRESATFAVNVTFVDGFEDLGETIILKLADTDFNAVEKKTGARVSVPAGLTTPHTYIIRGGKITLTNTKLGTVEASAETDDVVFWEGKISIGGQAIKLSDFKIIFDTYNTSSTNLNGTTDTKNTYWAIKNVRMLVDGDEHTSTCTSVIDVAWTNATPSLAEYTTTCTFDEIEIDEDSNIQFIADLTKYARPNTSITLVTNTSFGKNLITSTTTAAGAPIWMYDDANVEINASDFVGSIDLNTIKVQTPRGTLENTLTKTVEFVKGKSDTKTIFEGTYTAKNRDVYLNNFAATATLSSAQNVFDELTLKVYVDGEEVATSDVLWLTTTTLTSSSNFSKVLVEKGKSANIKVEAQAYPNNVTTESIEFSFTFAWEDSDGNDAGNATETAAKFKVITKGSVTVSDSTYPKNSIILRASNPLVAKFDLKPSNWSSEVDLESLYFTVKNAAGVDVNAANLKVKVAGKEVAIDGTATINTVSAYKVDSDLDETLESNWVTVEIYLKGIASNALSRNYTTTLVNVNDATTNVNRAYTKMVMPVEVTFSQKDMWWSTKFTAEMDKGDNDFEITRIDFYTAEAGTCAWAKDSTSALLNPQPKWEYECLSAPTAGTWTPAAASWSITSISESNNGEVEIEGSTSAKMINTIVITTTETAGATHANVYTIRKDDYNDYFKVGDTYLKIFKAD